MSDVTKPRIKEPLDEQVRQTRIFRAVFSELI